MKKLFSLLLFIVFVSVVSNAQTIQRKYEYGAVYYDSYGQKGKLIINYGNNRMENLALTKKIVLESHFDEDMKNIVDALNYMDEQGYELVSSYKIDRGGTTYGANYIFRREIKK